MGLRIDNDDIYKFHPPIPSERPRRLKTSIRRKDHSGEIHGHSTKPSADSGYKSLMSSIRSGGNSSQGTNYSSIQGTPRVSLGGRPASQASLTPSVSSRNEEQQSRKWWSGKSRKVKHAPSKSSFVSSGLTSRSPSTELLHAREIPDVQGQHEKGPVPMHISQPYNFQHHMHIQPHQFRRLAEKSQNDLIAEFSAMRAAQSATRQLDDGDNAKASSRDSCVNVTRSVPASFQVTARSSIHASEPASPRSDQEARQIGTKGSFSLPFRDGKSPKLQQQSSTEFLSMPPTEALITDAPEGKSAKGASSNCSSKVMPPESTTQLKGSPVKHDHPGPRESTDTITPLGLKTSFCSSPPDDEADDFKQLSPERRKRISSTRKSPHPPVPTFQAWFPDSEEIRVSMNRSSVNGGLFSSWAADDDSSDDDALPNQKSTPLRFPRQNPRNRLLQKAVQNAKGPPIYTAPVKPPPACPLPRVPGEQALLPRKVDNSATERVVSDGNESAVLSASDPGATVVECTDSVGEILAKGGFPARRPSNKSVRFKNEETFIPDKLENHHASDASLDRVQATLDDLRSNISRLEIDLSGQPLDPSDRDSQQRPKTAGSKDTPQPRHTAFSTLQQGSRPEHQGSRIPRPAPRVTRSGSARSKAGAKLPPLPPLPPSPFIQHDTEMPDRAHERTFSNGSTTLPATALPAPVAVQ